MIAGFAISAQAPAPALGKINHHKTYTINYNKGIGSVYIGMTRGGRFGVSRTLGAPQTTTKFTEAGVSGHIYEADYTDDELSVFYKNTAGKKRFDPVLGVATVSSEICVPCP